MKDDINIKIDIDPSIDITEVTVRAKEETELVRNIVSSVRQCVDIKRQKIAVQQGNSTRMIDQSDILRIYTEDRGLTVCTVEEIFWIRSSLKELEKILDSDWFVRISRFEVVNMNMVSGFDLSTVGTIKIIFKNGSSTWVARRYVRIIEERLLER